MTRELEIREVLEVYPHWETDHTAKSANDITGTVVFLGRISGDQIENCIEYGLRMEDSTSTAQSVRNAVQVWLDTGGVIPAWNPPTKIELREAMPPLSARKFRLSLHQSGHSLEQVDNAISAIEDTSERARVRIEWEYATEFKRTENVVVSLSLALGLMPEEVDVIWREAFLF